MMRIRKRAERAGSFKIEHKEKVESETLIEAQMKPCTQPNIEEQPKAKPLDQSRE